MAARRRRRKKGSLHPIIAGVKRRQREIATLTRAAQIVGLTLEEIVPTARQRKFASSPRKARAQMRKAFSLSAQAPAAPPPEPTPPAAPVEDIPPFLDKRKKKKAAAPKRLMGLETALNKAFGG